MEKILDSDNPLSSSDMEKLIEKTVSIALEQEAELCCLYFLWKQLSFEQNFAQNVSWSALEGTRKTVDIVFESETPVFNAHSPRGGSIVGFCGQALTPHTLDGIRV